MVGTASGSGTRTAVAIAQIRSVIKAFAERGFTSSEVLTQADRTLATVSMEQYATCAYAVVDAADGRVQIVNASHYPPLLVRQGLPTKVVDGSNNMALGMLELGGPDGFQAEDHRLSPGDILLMYTNGGLVRTRSQHIDDSLLAIMAATEGARTAEEVCGNILARCYGADDELEVGDTTLVALQYIPAGS
jgi:serine phosphatase RsbU (regulator of sigma subunit)